MYNVRRKDSKRKECKVSRKRRERKGEREKERPREKQKEETVPPRRGEPTSLAVQ